MDEISKIGDIGNVNDFFDFKLSIKTIIFLVVMWVGFCGLVVIFMLGGVNNTVDYMANIIESIKTTIVEIKNKNTGATSNTKKVENDDKNIDKKNNDN
jgi:hypothetical protein